VTSGSVSDDAAAGRSTRTNILAATAAVSSKRRASGDRRVLAVAPRVAQPSELTGCNGHGTPAYHQHVADELVATVRPALGW
jgi:small ligand-binding sensory domain FIST